ncbi:MAG: hypothetical protein ACOVQL_07125 [Limnohabitans sp.]|jgi:hypothetical protein
MAFSLQEDVLGPHEGILDRMARNFVNTTAFAAHLKARTALAGGQ